MTLRLYRPYKIMLVIYAVFLAAAFIISTPSEILAGLRLIMITVDVLITDYAEVGGFGAMLVNSVIVSLFSMAMLLRYNVKPDGTILMALWMNCGFALFGKNPVNMWPLTLGVYLYAKAKKEPFVDHIPSALLSATLSPVVSSIGFLNLFHPAIDIFLGICLGTAAGFILPAVTAFTFRIHSGYNLYNAGFAGGLISTFLVSLMKSVGIDIPTAMIWSSGNNVKAACLLYITAAVLLISGFFSDQKKNTPANIKVIMKQSGRLISDFYIEYKNSVFVNMGILCLFSTTISLLLGFDLNGPTMGGILTITGFGCLGKHLRNITPVFLGAVLSTYVNMWDLAAPHNSLSILFSAGLAPIAGQFGWAWGILAGFLHVNLSIHIGYLNNGLNLYNNGYAAGFVAMVLIPLTSAFGKKKGENQSFHPM